MNAVMQLAQAASQQQHYGQDAEHSPIDTSKRKRQASPTSRQNKSLQRGDVPPSTSQQWPPSNWSSWPASESFVKLFGNVPGLDTGSSHHPQNDSRPQSESQDASAEDPDHAAASGDEPALLARNGRPLSATKRAAQNRAAQRAFRARRDE